MNRFWGFGLLGAGLCGALAACSGGSDSGSPAANGGDGNAAGAGADSCVKTPDAVFPAQQFGESDLIRQIAVDGSTLYFRTQDTVLKVPAAGGKPEVVADLSMQEPSEFWLQADTLLVRSDDLLLTVPKAGGAPTALGAALLPAPTNFAATQLNGTDFYWVANDSSNYGIYHRTLSGSTVDTVYSSKDELRDLQLVGSTLYFVNKTAADIEGVPAAGGTPTKLTAADTSDDIVSGDDKSLFVIGSLGAQSSTNYGLYRQPITGGDAVLLQMGAFITDALDTATDSSGAYFAAPSNVSPNHADPTDVSPALIFAAPSDTAAQLRWCIASSYTLHALAVQDKTAYVSVYSGSANKATIARVTLP